MSIRGLLSTAFNASEKAIKGTVHLGEIVGNGADWLVRQSEQWNDEDTVIAEKTEYQAQIKERLARAVGINGDYSDKELTAEVVAATRSYKEMMKELKALNAE